MQEPDIHLLLKELCCAAGVNGLSDIQTVACDWLKKFADDVRVDVSGNVLATLPCGKEKASVCFWRHTWTRSVLSSPASPTAALCA